MDPFFCIILKKKMHGYFLHTDNTTVRIKEMRRQIYISFVERKNIHGSFLLSQRKNIHGSFFLSQLKKRIHGYFYSFIIAQYLRVRDRETSSRPRDKTKTNNKDNRETFLVARLHHITNLHEDLLGLPANCETKRNMKFEESLQKFD